VALTIISQAFVQDGTIPPQYTCEGHDLSPPLSWSHIPAGTKSLALIVDDPDAPDPAAPQRTYVHWVVYNIPVTATGFEEAVSLHNLPSGTLVGNNDWQKAEYGGPCPPIGRHRYFFKLYALDTVLPNLNGPSKADLEKAMKGHILEQAQLMGTYQKLKSKLPN